MVNIVNDFNRLRGNLSFPNVFGCVDGTHIEIPKPMNGNSYYNRKGYHSIVIQAICDAKMYFLDIFVGWPGSVSDSRVWRNSPIYEKLTNEPASVIPGSHLLGDKAYPLSTFLMVSFKNNGHLSDNQKKINRILCKTRVIIEQAFAQLKNAFRCSHFLNKINLSDIKNQIMSICILHNIRLTESYPVEELVIEEDDNDYENVNVEDNIAVEKRNYLVNVIANL
ncbi:hypothetical protein MML48_3g00005519 [Holotrichia oblita]|uniref:Uncharacterized protein n=1 Tax=Holotrichia oblita TaxID=644536 RepID=A0ACB9TC27_HOLOL|nr:hypothetical protein MML48_3g00005519 [Holotrichia oblita]